MGQLHVPEHLDSHNALSRLDCDVLPICTCLLMHDCELWRAV